MSKGDVALPKGFEGLGNAAEYAAALTQSAQENSSGGGNFDTDLLKLDQRSGDWAYGPADDEVELTEDDELLVHPGEFQHGLLDWAGQAPSKPYSDVMVPVTDPMPDEEELEEPKGEWKVQARALLVHLTDDYDEEEGRPQIEFKISSKGGLNAMGDLQRKVAQQIRAQLKAGTAFICPIVKLGNRPFTTSHGDHRAPVFNIIAWANVEGDREEEPAVIPPKASGPSRKKGTRKKAASKKASRKKTPKAAATRSSGGRRRRTR